MATDSLPDLLAETLGLFDSSGTPLTTTEVAAQLPIGRRCADERLERLADQECLDTKQVGASGRVWWRPSTADGHEPDRPTEQTQRVGRPNDGRDDEQDDEKRDDVDRPESTTPWFEALFENSPDMIDVLDPAGRLLEVNQQLCTELGYSEAELVGKGVWEYDQSIDADGVERVLSELSVDEPRKFEARYLRADGSTFPVEVNLIRLSTAGEDRFLAVGRDITERKAYEQQLVSERERVDALNDLNAVIREIINTVIEQSTREEIETTVCERLAGTDSYQLAWIGEVDTAAETVDIRTEAGMTEYTDEITISLGEDDQSGCGPTGRALQTGDVQVVNDIPNNATYDPWHDTLTAYGVRSSAAIPIGHEGTTYGVLNIYADRFDAFEQQERAVIEQLGEGIGHAIAATERKRALLSTELIELEFRIPNLGDVYETTTELNGTLTLDDVVPIANDEFLVYGTATEAAIESLTSLVEAVPHWKTVEFKEGDEPVSFELRLSDPPVLSEIASDGGYIDSAVVENGDYRMTIHLAPSADVSQVAALVRRVYPQVEMLRRRQITNRHDSSRCIYRRLAESLTDCQSSAVETAYHAGYFAWPRDSSAEDVAATLGVAPATFHQHLRKAQKQVFDELLSTTSQQRLPSAEE